MRISTARVRVGGRGARPRISRLAAPAAAGVLALVLAGCSNYTGGHGQQVAEWAQGASLSSNDGLVVADVRGIAAGIKRHELVATRTECDGLATDAATAYGQLPTPDTALTGDLNTAYLDYTKAAQDCTSAASFAAAGFARYRREIADANAALATAQRRMKALGAS